MSFVVISKPSKKQMCLATINQQQTINNSYFFCAVFFGMVRTRNWGLNISFRNKSALTPKSLMI